MSKFLKITTSLLIFIFAFSLVSAIAFSAQAADEIQFTPQITVGEFQAGATTTVESNTIGKYIESIYTYAISIVGILAALFIIIGGLQWLTSAGNQEKVSEAKARIVASLSGLVLVLCSWLLLSIINPDLVSFRSLDTSINLPEEEEEDDTTGCCEWPDGGSATLSDEDYCTSGDADNGIIGNFIPGGIVDINDDTNCVAPSEPVDINTPTTGL